MQSNDQADNYRRLHQQQTVHLRLRDVLADLQPEFGHFAPNVSHFTAQSRDVVSHSGRLIAQLSDVDLEFVSGAFDVGLGVGSEAFDVGLEFGSETIDVGLELGSEAFEFGSETFDVGPGLSAMLFEVFLDFGSEVTELDAKIPDVLLGGDVAWDGPPNTVTRASAWAASKPAACRALVALSVSSPIGSM